jgi:hypothetical protein
MHKAFLFVTVVFSSLAFAAGPDPGVNVTVTNTSSQPVPVTLQGTNAITGSVTVTNTPNVNVQNEVAVRSTDNPAQQAVQFATSFPLNGSPNFGGLKDDAYTVPAGKRLVIEYVATEFILNGASSTGRGLLSVDVTNPGSFKTPHALGTSSEAVPCTGSQSCLVISKTVRIYAEPGAKIGFTASGTQTLPPVLSFVSVVVNGHLVDL